MPPFNIKAVSQLFWEDGEVMPVSCTLECPAHLDTSRSVERWIVPWYTTRTLSWDNLRHFLSSRRCLTLRKVKRINDKLFEAMPRYSLQPLGPKWLKSCIRKKCFVSNFNSLGQTSIHCLINNVFIQRECTSDKWPHTGHDQSKWGISRWLAQ